MGVFQIRIKPFTENMTMLPSLCKLQKISPDPAFAKALDEGLSYWTDPGRIKGEQRFIGDYISLVDEVTSR